MTSLVSATWTGRMDEEAHARGVPARLWEGRHGAGLISHRRKRGPSILIHRCASGGASGPSQEDPSGPSVGDLPFPCLPSSGPFPSLPLHLEGAPQVPILPFVSPIDGTWAPICKRPHTELDHHRLASRQPDCSHPIRVSNFRFSVATGALICSVSFWASAAGSSVPIEQEIKWALQVS